MRELIWLSAEAWAVLESHLPTNRPGEPRVDDRRIISGILHTEVVIPSNSTRRHPYPLDHVTYRKRNVIERMFCRMKDWRRIAARYNRLARNFLSSVALVATVSV